MTMRKHLFCLALAGSLLFPLYSSHADPGESCGEAMSGTVPEVEGYCDIYARQLDYKRAAKEFRDSLEARRKSYEAPRIEALELYRQNLEEIYKEESKEYQAKLAEIDESGVDDGMDYDESMSSDDSSVSEDMPWRTMNSEDSDVSSDTEEKMAEAPVDNTDMSENDGDVGVQEKEIDESDDGTRKKVIMPEDAPDFDGSPF